MFRKMFFLCICVVTVPGFAQNRPRIPDNKELVTRARSVYVHSETFYMKRENLESSLLGRKEFKAWDLQITADAKRADLWVRVRRIPFSNHFNYTVTDHETETVVMAGKVDSLAGTVYGLIADEIIHKMKVYRGDPLAQPAPQPAARSAPAPVDPNP
ncbi:MAG TPA: hypothetical protein VN176_15680 [Verrucomicrobiae bacterium]|jgi:hypothetical protein|nr:hypothetical protein [Verrucomicrobiae bacterium]